MAKFYGAVGYGINEEVSPGVWDDVIKERMYFGDIERDTAKWREGGKINSDLDVANVIDILADAYAFEHYYAMRYVEWQGALWRITEVQEQRPRLTLRLGGVYNGPRARTKA